MEGSVRFYGLAKPYLGIIFLQLGSVGRAILAKLAMDKGMSPHVFVFYRQAVATLVIDPFAILFERKVQTKMTFSLFFKIVILGIEPVIDQNSYLVGVKLTTVTFGSAIYNIVPASAFLMAWACRLEKVSILNRGSQEKNLGTIVTVGGAMIMTFIRGPMLDLPWTKANQSSASSSGSPNHQSPLKGFLVVAIRCICWSAFVILQAMTLKKIPSGVVTYSIHMLGGHHWKLCGSFDCGRGNPSAWALHFDSRLLAVLYTVVICSVVTYYIQGVVMQTKGPVFVTAFSPLSMILIAIMSSLILSEIMFLGRIIGAVAIIIGVYLVLWGKSKDQLPVKSSCDNIIPSERQMTVMDEDPKKKTVQSNEEFVVLDVAKEEKFVNSKQVNI